MSEFERRFGKYAIPNLTLYLIAGYAVGYMIQLINSEFLLYLSLDVYKILHGQIWRVITWILIPPYHSDILWTAILMYFCYNIGRSVERLWGTYRFNVFFFSGIIITVISAFLAYVIFILLYGNDYFLLLEVLYPYLWYAFGTYYINVSLFLALAMTIPDQMGRYMFIIPVKLKWLGFLDLFFLAYIAFSARRFDDAIFTWCAIGAALLNCLLFYLFNIKKIRTPKQAMRNAQFQQNIRKASASKITRHKCAICGKTEESDPNMEFRFCSKCNGNYEYCSTHLFTHTHVK